MAMLSPYFVDKEPAFLYNLANETIRNQLHGIYVLVHNYTPSTGACTPIPPSTLRELCIRSLAPDPRTGSTAKGSYIRLSNHGRFLHNIVLYPSTTPDSTTPALYGAEEVTWEAPRHIGTSSSYTNTLKSGGVLRCDTQAAVTFADSEGDINHLSDEWLEERNIGLPDARGLPHLEKLVVGTGMHSLKAAGSTITFGFVANKPREEVEDLRERPDDDREGLVTRHVFQEGFEFAQLELAHALMPGANEPDRGGREVLVFIKMPRDLRTNVSSAFIAQQRLEWHVVDILREIRSSSGGEAGMGGMGMGMVVKEQFGHLRKREHPWMSWGGRNKTLWIGQLVSGVVDAAAGFDAALWEEVRASLPLGVGVEVLDALLRRLRAETERLEVLMQRGGEGEGEVERFVALNDALAYLGDRARGVRKYMELARAWRDGVVEIEEVMGREVRRLVNVQPKMPLEEVPVEPSAVPLPGSSPSSPKLRLDPQYEFLIKRFNEPGAKERIARERKARLASLGIRERVRVPKVQKEVQPEEEERGDLEFFQKAIGRPLPRGLLGKMKGSKPASNVSGEGVLTVLQPPPAAPLARDWKGDVVESARALPKPRYDMVEEHAKADLTERAVTEYDSLLARSVNMRKADFYAEMERIDAYAEPLALTQDEEDNVVLYGTMYGPGCGGRDRSGEEEMAKMPPLQRVQKREVREVPRRGFASVDGKMMGGTQTDRKGKGKAREIVILEDEDDDDDEEVLVVGAGDVVKQSRRGLWGRAKGDLGKENVDMKGDEEGREVVMGGVDAEEGELDEGEGEVQMMDVDA